jgi:histidyl-tRNA synthetase
MPEAAEAKARTTALLPLSPEGAEKALVLARDLRALGIRCEVDGRTSKLKAMLSRAERRGTTLCVLLGEEVARGTVAVKDLASRTQEEIPLDTAAQRIATMILGEPRGSR